MYNVIKVEWAISVPAYFDVPFQSISEFLKIIYILLLLYKIMN